MEHMFDWLYKQANLQSMCSVTSLAVQPECQHDSAKLGASCSPPPPRALGRQHWPAGSRGRAAARGTCGLLGSLRRASAAGGLQAPASGGKEKKKRFPAGLGRWCRGR